MHYEPDIDAAGLIAFLSARYDMDIERLEFVPMGIDSWSYVVTERHGRRAFLKLFAAADAQPRDRGHELPLIAALAELGSVAVPAPVADRDRSFVNTFGRLALYILDYVQGRSLEDEAAWPEPLYATVAQTLAAIHGSTDHVRRHVRRVERFELAFLDPLVARIADLERSASAQASDTGELCALRELLLPRVPQLREQIARLTQLRETARNRQQRRVLCHTDLWGSNMLLDRDDRLWVVDWDGAVLAPPEADLFMFATTSFFPTTRFGTFLDDYQASYGPTQLDAETIAFYAYRRILEDLAWFVESLATPQADGVPASDALRFASGALSDLAMLEPQIAATRDVLRERTHADERVPSAP